MARGVNKVILVGNLGKDPETTYTPNGLAIAKFSLATSEKRKNQSGDLVEKTEWHRITCFGKTAEIASQYLQKGRQVYIEGKISYGSYEKDGVKMYTTDIIVKELQFLGSRGDGQSQQSGGGDRWQQQPPPQNSQQGGQQGQSGNNVHYQEPEQFDDPGNQDYEEDLPF